MNAKKPDAKGVSKISLSKSVLWKMAYGERRAKTTCPLCQKYKNFDDLACDACISRYGDELNKVIINALCEIRPSKYPQKRSTSLQFEIVEELNFQQKEIPTKEEAVDNGIKKTGEENPITINKGNNLLEVAPGFFLYEDEVKKMAINEFGVRANCPICKKPKAPSSWMCFSCGKDRKEVDIKVHLIQYAIIRIRPKSNFLDGNICEKEIEEILLDVAVRILSSPAKDFFCRDIPYLKTLLRYLPSLDSWTLPIAYCIISKVIFHAFTIINGKPRFRGVVVDNCQKAEEKLLVNSDMEDTSGSFVRVEISQDNKAAGGSVEPVDPAPLKAPVKEDFLVEASDILAGIKENFNEDSRTGKALAAFLFQKVLEWKEATGKKNPDTREFFAKVPFSEKFLEQLKQSGNCALKFFTELAEYFTMSGEEILAEGLLIQSQKENLQKSSLPETDLEKNNQEKIVVDDSTEVVDKKTNPEEQLADDEEIVFVKLAKSLLEKVQKNLKEAPLVARALWAFINYIAKEKGMTIVGFGKTIGIYASSLCALKIGGNKQQCLSVSKFKEVVARLGLSKEIIIARGLEFLVKEGDTSARESFSAMKNSGEPKKVSESLKN